MMSGSIKTTRVLAFASGKGGVGKTLLSLNTAVALARQHHSVVLFDGDMGLANVHVLLGTQPRATVADVLAGRCDLAQTMFVGPEGIKIIPGGSGIRDLADLPSGEFARLLQGLQDVQPPPDYLIIDTGAGIGSHVTTLVQLADIVVVVVRDEPASLADAYGLIKVAHTEFQCQSFHIVVNDVKDAQRGQQVFTRLQDVAMRFLGLPLTLSSVVPHDDSITDAMRRRESVVTAFPESRAAAAIRRLAGELSNAALATDAKRFLLDKLGRGRGVAMP